MVPTTDWIQKTSSLQLRVDQFFSDGFVERKIIFVHDILKLCQLRHIELKRERGKKPTTKMSKGALQSPTAPLVERHGRSSSASPSGNIQGSHAYSNVLDNEEIGLPRMAGPPAPTPLGHALFTHSARIIGSNGMSASGPPFAVDQPDRVFRQAHESHFRSSVRSSSEDMRSASPKPVVIQGARGGHNDAAAQKAASEDTGSQDDYEEDGTRPLGLGADGGEDDYHLFLSREALAQQQQHAPGTSCHNDSLVLRMSESILVLVERVEQLEGKVQMIAEHAIAADKLARVSDTAREESEARLLLAEGRIRMLEQQIYDMTCEAAVSKVYGSAADAQASDFGLATAERTRSPQAASKLANKHTDLLVDSDSSERQDSALAAEGAAQSLARSWTHSRDAVAARSSEAPSLEEARNSRSARLAPSLGDNDQGLEKFIASITERFKETNELLVQSNEKLKRRQAPIVADTALP
jgi:hypothetical protein